jgi:hypothetical protein
MWGVLQGRSSVNGTMTIYLDCTTTTIILPLQNNDQTSSDLSGKRVDRRRSSLLARGLQALKDLYEDCA